MPAFEFQLFENQERNNRVRLRTLVTLRWIATFGQAITIVVAVNAYNLQIEVGLAALVISISVIANVSTRYVYPGNKYLTEREAMFWLAFDIIQLSMLLFLTGGLNNPFAVLVLAPVTIAAAILHLRSTVFLGLLTIVLMSLLGPFHLPIITAEGVSLRLPDLFRSGFWAALIISMVFLGIYLRQITSEMHAMGNALFATQLALAREQKLTEMDSVVAAAAHELGTPLATIKLASSELMEELKNHPHLLEDAELIRSQADRCRDILRSMGRSGKDDLHLRKAPLETVVREAAEPHIDRGKDVRFLIAPTESGDPTQPIIARRPEIVHGLRNLFQNAVDFSKAAIWVDVNWSHNEISVRISDDGPGFPPSVIGRIGDPYVKRKRLSEDGNKRPGYESMGLGLFIAKTLLERSGAQLTFHNSRRNGHATWTRQAAGGAIVDIVWPRDALIQTGTTPGNAL